jgi:hypothetical protein
MALTLVSWLSTSRGYLAERRQWRPFSSPPIAQLLAAKQSGSRVPTLDKDDNPLQLLTMREMTSRVCLPLDKAEI